MQPPTPMCPVCHPQSPATASNIRACEKEIVQTVRYPWHPLPSRTPHTYTATHITIISPSRAVCDSESNGLTRAREPRPLASLRRVSSHEKHTQKKLHSLVFLLLSSRLCIVSMSRIDSHRRFRVPVHRPTLRPLPGQTMLGFAIWDPRSTFHAMPLPRHGSLSPPCPLCLFSGFEMHYKSRPFRVTGLHHHLLFQLSSASVADQQSHVHHDVFFRIQSVVPRRVHSIASSALLLIQSLQVVGVFFGQSQSIISILDLLSQHVSP